MSTPEKGSSVAGRFDLTGRVALVTGGSRGLGRAMALGLAEAGADVVVASRKLDACVETAAAIEALGRRALAVPVNMSHWDELDGLVDAAYDHFGRIDVLVNNAGHVAPLPATSPRSRRRCGTRWSDST